MYLVLWYMDDYVLGNWNWGEGGGGKEYGGGLGDKGGGGGIGDSGCEGGLVRVKRWGNWNRGGGFDLNFCGEVDF